MRQTLPRLLPLLILIAALLGGCSDENNNAGTGQDATKVEKTLRILRPRQVDGLDYLPRTGMPQSEELKLLEEYARSVGMKPEYVYVDSYDKLIPELLAGHGDIVADNLTVTASRRKQVRFTSPVSYVREQIIARKGEAPKDAHDLKGRSVAVHASDSYYETLQKVRKQRFQPPFDIHLVDESVSTEAILNGVAEGRYDLAVADSNLSDEMLNYHDDLQVAFDISSVRPIAWAVRPDDKALLASINDFLGKLHLAGTEKKHFSGDLEQIKKRKVLRVLTRNNATTYFLWRGELLGFEYELAKRFADEHHLRLEMVVPPTREDLIPWLEQGRGDIIAASLTITPERKALKDVAFSRPYHKVSEILVSRSNDKALQNPEQLAGRTVVVRRSSSYWDSLQKLKQQGINFTLKAAPENMETEELIDRVAGGEYDLTVADSHILDIELTWRDDIRAAFPLGEPRSHGWMVRKGNPHLLTAINQYLKKEYRGLFYNVTYRKYFKNPKRILSHVEQRVDSQSNADLSPYDKLARKYAQQYGLDWRLVVSQMFQESRFNPNAKSWVGALGLLQVMPRTGKEFGLENLRDPETGLHAGVQYLDWLMRRFEPELPIADRTWFALAAYNAGIGHVRDARTLAKQLGLDPDHWFGNVEKAMLLLSKRHYAKKAKHGYVRGEEPVSYVREIRDRYLAYVKLKDDSAAMELTQREE